MIPCEVEPLMTPLHKVSQGGIEIQQRNYDANHDLIAPVDQQLSYSFCSLRDSDVVARFPR